MYYIDIETGVIGVAMNLVFTYDDKKINGLLEGASDSEIINYATMLRMEQDGFWD